MATKTSARVARLLILVELRKVFRNCIRAESLLQQDSPVYKPANPREQAERACLVEPVLACRCCNSACPWPCLPGIIMGSHQTQQCPVPCVTTITERLVAELMPAGISTSCLELILCQQQRSLALLRHFSTAPDKCPPLPALLQALSSPLRRLSWRSRCGRTQPWRWWQRCSSLQSSSRWGPLPAAAASLLLLT